MTYRPAQLLTPAKPSETRWGQPVLMPTPSHSPARTAFVTGTVRDEQGAVIPGAMVALISSARGTRVAETETNESGDFVFPNVPGDTYMVEVTLQGFRAVRREGVNVSPG